MKGSNTHCIRSFIKKYYVVNQFFFINSVLFFSNLKLLLMPILPVITNGSITAMSPVVTNHPVYKITIGGIDYVIKAETAGGNDASSDVKWASKIMHNVVDDKTDTTKIRLLGSSEIDVIATVYTNFLVGPSIVTFEMAMDNANNVWYMMHFQPSLFNPSDNMDDGMRNQLFAIVNHGTFWKKFGKIIAVDLFTGNNDRFDFGYYEEIYNGNNADFWSNKGNVFVNISNIDKAVPLGMDFFFAQNAFGNDQLSDQKFIKIMKNNDQIDIVAELIIASVTNALAGKQLGEKTNKFSKFKSFATTKIRKHQTTQDKYKAYLSQSIKDGLQEIKQYLISKRATYQARTQANNNQPNWQTNAMVQQPANWQTSALAQPRVAPQVPNHRAGNQTAATVPVTHNNMAVSKDVFPPRLEARMRSLGWIV
jgi:hypothetical protein